MGGPSVPYQKWWHFRVAGNTPGTMDCGSKMHDERIGVSSTKVLDLLSAANKEQMELS
jgi:hypothetical protein